MLGNAFLRGTSRPDPSSNCSKQSLPVRLDGLYHTGFLWPFCRQNISHKDTDQNGNTDSSCIDTFHILHTLHQECG